MRNLKRALSLALASVMLLGMMVVGTSAASYPDVDEKDNIEAIEVLNAVKVMIGDRGNFNPDKAVNRHEMAVIMAKLVLGNEIADNYVGSHPFTDVAPWADKYVAACYENGIAAGTSKTTFGGEQPLTAVQAAAFMLRALGYKDLSKDASDWSVPVTAKANEIRLFNGVAANPKEQLTRNQVAQLALNTLKSPIVTLIDGTFDITSGEGNVVISGGSREYKVIARSDAYARAISAVESQGSGSEGINGWTVELGEQLYNGKLRLSDNAVDDFGRPARKWEYDGKAIGTYAKTELLTKEYVGKVTGKDLYDLLGSSTIRDYNLLVTIDGVVQNTNTFRAQMDRDNKAAVGATGTGVLTQVYTDSTGRGTIYIAIINTYLAKAAKDYDEKKEELTVTIYGVNGSGDYVKTKTQRSNVDLEAEDLPIVKDVKKDDILLVTVAGRDVKSVARAEALEGVQVASFKTGSNVTVNGQKYDFADAAYYDNTALSVYTGNGGTVNLKDTTYNIYLDTYGNLLGIKEVEAKKNYVFIAGIDNDGSNIATKTGKARALFLDGTSEVIEYNAEKSSISLTRGPLVNTWCTYTKNSSNVYTLTRVDSTGYTGATVPANVPNGTTRTLAQFHETNSLTAGKTIDKQNIGLVGGGSSNYSVVYGNKDTVYLTAKLGKVTTGGSTYGIINGVDNVTVSAEKANVLAWNSTDAATKYNGAVAGGHASGVYTLYNDKGIVIAAVVVGEDSGAAKNLVYAHTGGLEQEAYGQSETRTGEDEWTWTRKVIKDGEEVLLTEKGDSSSYLEKMVKGNWYEVKMNSNDEVIDANRIVVTVSGDGKDEKGLDKVAMTGKTRYITNNTLIGSTVSDTGVDTVLYCQRFTNDKLTTNGWTLYVTTTNPSGFLVKEDAKIVLQQYDRNTQETYIEVYDGADNLEGIVDEMNERNNNKAYNYQVSAVLESGSATSVVINSEVSDWTSGGGNAGKPSGDVEGTTITINYDEAIYNSGSYLEECLRYYDSVIVDNVGDIPYAGTIRIPADTTLAFTGDVAKEANISIGSRAALLVDGEFEVDGTPASIGANATVRAGSMDVTASITIAGKVTVDGALNVAADRTIDLTGDLTVNAGTNTSAVTGSGTIHVKSANSLHVTGNVIKTIKIIAGNNNAAENGRVVINGTMAGTFIDKNVKSATVSTPVQDITKVTGAVTMSGDAKLTTEQFNPSSINLTAGAQITLEKGTATTADSGTDLTVKDANGNDISNTTSSTTITVANNTTSKTDVVSDTAATDSAAPISAVATVVYNKKTWDDAVAAGYKPINGLNNKMTWENFTDAAHGKTTMPWLLVKVTAERDITNSTISGIVKKNGTTISSAADTWAVASDATVTKDTAATFHWDLSETNSDKTGSAYLKQANGSLTGTYTIEFTWTVNGKTVEGQTPYTVTASYTEPAVLTVPSFKDQSVTVDMSTMTITINKVVAVDKTDTTKLSALGLPNTGDYTLLSASDTATDYAAVALIVKNPSDAFTKYALKNVKLPANWADDTFVNGQSTAILYMSEAGVYDGTGTFSLKFRTDSGTNPIDSTDGVEYVFKVVYTDTAKAQLEEIKTAFKTPATGGTATP